MCIIRAGTMVAKQLSKLRQQKRMNIRRFAHVFNNFISVALTLIGYRMASKLDYCFIISTNLVLSLFLLGFSIAGQRNETDNTASNFLEHAHIIDHMFRLHKCAYANIKLGTAEMLWRKKCLFWIRSKHLKVQRFEPFSQHWYTVYVNKNFTFHFVVRPFYAL